MHRPQLVLGRRVLLSVALVGAASLAPPGAPAFADPTAGTRQQQYASAAAEYGVPQSVLLGVSYLESRWDTNAGAPSTAAGYGPMHLTDAQHVRALPVPAHYGPAEDPRGDSARPMTVHPPAPKDGAAAGDADGPSSSAAGGPAGPSAASDGSDAPSVAALQTATAAQRLTGVDAGTLRTDPASNIRGGAALLAAYQKEIGGPAGSASDPAAWYGAVARYSGADSSDAAAAFANEVYATIRTGAERTTDDGQHVRLAPTAVDPIRSWLDRLRLRTPKPRPDGLECPTDVACVDVPAPYEQYGPTVGDYGNHDLSDRPARQKIDYIVIHDTEGSWATTLDLIKDPTYVSWNYTIRSADGLIAQHVKTKDVAWHAGNWYVNAKSVGVEHEGFAAQGTWYTEAMYRTSAKLVGYLARGLGIPLDRQHIIGHDNVPGITPANVKGMHWDPGPYWDWSHYFDLLHAPFRGTRIPAGGAVTIDPDLTTNQPAFTGCDTSGSGTPCPAHGSSAVILHTAPSEDAPLLTDLGLHPDGSPATMDIADHGSRVSAGQTYAVADRQRDWTAIWYLGQKGWFHNPVAAPTAKWTVGLVATPKAGKATIPVYGRAYPEQSAYPAGVPYQAITPLQYTLSAGQRYVVGGLPVGEYYRATTFDGSSPGDWTVVRGKTRYVQVQFGHRIMFVNLADVDLLPSPIGAPH